jgi:hypothetical protein
LFSIHIIDDEKVVKVIGKKKMIARISTHFICTETDLWLKIIEPKALQFVAWPILSFIPDETGALDGEWIVGKKYNLRLFFLKFIPLGRHIIQLVNIDKTANTISSQEKGKLARVWNHDITFHEVYPGKVHYIDKIEISAGLLSPAHGIDLSRSFAAGDHPHDVAFAENAAAQGI